MSTMRIDDIDTPAPVVDLDRVERNLKRAAGVDIKIKASPSGA
jgi:D-serine deaminase-like pyridoxal phosphate-dependent protein